MSYNYNKLIDNIRNYHVLARFESERDFLVQEQNNPDRDQDEIKDRLSKIEKIINMLKEETTTQTNTTQEELFEEIDKYLYKKPWNRLNPIQRVNKMKEYLKKNIENSELRDQIEKEIFELLSNKKLNTKKSVVYNPETEEIESVPALKINKDSEYEIKT